MKTACLFSNLVGNERFYINKKPSEKLVVKFKLVWSDKNNGFQSFNIVQTLCPFVIKIVSPQTMGIKSVVLTLSGDMWLFTTRKK